MRSGTTEIEISHWRRVLRGTVRGPQHQELVERELTVMPVPAGHAELAFEVERRQQLSGDDQRTQAGCMLFEHIENAFLELLAMGIPAAFDVVWRVLNDGG